MFIYNPSGDVLVSDIDQENEIYNTTSSSLISLGMPMEWLFQFESGDASGDINILNQIDPENSGNFVQLEINEVLQFAIDIY